MNHNEATFTGANGAELHYQCWKPDGDSRGVLAIIHGFGEHSGRYMNVVDQMMPSGITVYGFDHRGHGRSEGKRGYIINWQEFREDVQIFLQMIRGQEKDPPIVLFGHSMGGLIVLNYLLKNDQEKIIAAIASSPLLAQPGISPILIMLSRILSRIWPGFSIETGLDAQTISRDQKVVDAYLNDPLVHSTATARFGTELTTTIEWTQAHAADFKFPLLVYHGEMDQLVPVQGSRDFFSKMTIKDKSLNIFEQGYHEPHNDIDKDTVLGDLTDWIEKHLAE